MSKPTDTSILCATHTVHLERVMDKAEAAQDAQCVRFYSESPDGCGLQIRGLVHRGKAIAAHATLTLDDMRTLRAALDQELHRRGARS